MKKLLFLALLVPACVVGEGGQTPPPGDDEPPPPPDTGLSGHIATDTTWEGVIDITGVLTIDPGVTVTVMPGTTINVGAFPVNTLIQGNLVAHGLKGQEINVVAAGASFSNFFVGGTLDYAYVLQHGGGVSTTAGGTATIVDTKMFAASGDLLVMNGGTVSLTHSQLGADAGTADTTHCNMHFGGDGNTVTINNNNIEGSPYGLQLFGGTGTNFQNNNWDANATAEAAWVDSGPQVTADFTGSFFSNGDPVAKPGATFTVASSTTRLTDAGVR